MKESDKQIIEQNKSDMQRLYEENRHLTDTQTISKIVDKFFECAKEKGEHFCLHEQDWGCVKTSLANIEKKLDAVIDNNTENTSRLDKIETENQTKEKDSSKSWMVLGLVVGNLIALGSLIVAIMAINGDKNTQKDVRYIYEHSYGVQDTLAGKKIVSHKVPEQTDNE